MRKGEAMPSHYENLDPDRVWIYLRLYDTQIQWREGIPMMPDGSRFHDHVESWVAEAKKATDLWSTQNKG